MKKLFTSMLCVFIAIPLFLTVWGFALPAQYSNTFVGELPAASYTSYCLSYAWSPYAETFAH